MVPLPKTHEEGGPCQELVQVGAEVKVVNKLMWICVTLLATGLIKIFLEGN